MTFHYNRNSEKRQRRELRNNATPAEKIGKQIESLKFRRQYSIDSFVVDFYCPAIKLAIEIDGDSHVTEEVMEYDFDRQKHIEAFGVSFLRFTNKDVYDNIESVLENISQTARKLKEARR